MLEQVDAHGLGGDLIVPDGLEGPAVGGVDQQHDDGDADADDHERSFSVSRHMLKLFRNIQCGQCNPPCAF